MNWENIGFISYSNIRLNSHLGSVRLEAKTISALEWKAQILLSILLITCFVKKPFSPEISMVR